MSEIARILKNCWKEKQVTTLGADGAQGLLQVLGSTSVEPPKNSFFTS